MLTQAAISVANTERRVLERDAPVLPLAISESKRKSAYETSVVENFFRLGFRHFERHGSVAMWERPYLTGLRGRPEATDISLFDSANGLETRIEFGDYSFSKLLGDAEKLSRLASTSDPAYPSIVNYVVLWEELSKKLTERAIRDWRRRATDDAARVSASVPKSQPGATASLLLVSGVDLFSEVAGRHRIALVAMFAIQPRSTSSTVVSDEESDTPPISQAVQSN